jgi:hypothetical protein
VRSLPEPSKRLTDLSPALVAGALIMGVAPYLLQDSVAKEQAVELAVRAFQAAIPDGHLEQTVPQCLRATGAKKNAARLGSSRR